MGEIKEVFRGKNINDAVWKGIIKEVDDNGDGKVYYFLIFLFDFKFNQISNAEFKSMMLKLLDKDEPASKEAKGASPKKQENRI